MKRIQMILPATLIILCLGCGAKRDYKNKATPENIEISKPQSISEDESYNTDTTVSPGYNQFVTPSGSSTNKSIPDDNTSRGPLTSSAAVGLPEDGVRKFIKTADIKFRVQNVLNATYSIEDFTGQFGGFVTRTHLDSHTDRTSIVPISPDSSIESVYYTVTNSMTIRVPQKNLDSLLRSFTPLVAYLDHRHIDVEDVHLQILADELLQARVKNYQSRLKKTVDTKDGTIADKNQAEENILNRQEQADNSLIEKLTILDKIEYSTIQLNIYQRQCIKREVIFTGKEIAAYEPGFLSQMGKSFNTGLKAVQSLILFAMQFWFLFALGIFGAVVFRIVRGKK